MMTYNSHPVSDVLGHILGAVQSDLAAKLGTPAAAEIKASCSRGQYGQDKDSGGTHFTGMAVDFLCGAWHAAWIQALVHSCHSHGLQAVLRLVGDNDGASEPVPVQHVHACVNGQSNSAAVLATTEEPDGKWALSRQLVRRGN